MVLSSCALIASATPSRLITPLLARFRQLEYPTSTKKSSTSCNPCKTIVSVSKASSTRLGQTRSRSRSRHFGVLVMLLFEAFAGSQDLLGVISRIGTVYKREFICRGGRFGTDNAEMQHLRQHAVLLGGNIFQV